MSKSGNNDHKETKNEEESLRGRRIEREMRHLKPHYTPPSSPSSTWSRISSLFARSPRDKSAASSRPVSSEYQTHEENSQEFRMSQQPYLLHGVWNHSSTPPMSEDGATYNTPGGPRREKTRGLVIRNLPKKLSDHRWSEEIQLHKEDILRMKFEGVRGKPIQGVYFFKDMRTGEINGYASVLFYTAKDAEDAQWRTDDRPWGGPFEWREDKIIVELDQRDLAKGPDLPRPAPGKEHSIVVDAIPPSMNHHDVGGLFGHDWVAKAVVARGRNGRDDRLAVVVFHLESSAESAARRERPCFMGRRDEQREVTVNRNRDYTVDGWEDGDCGTFLALNPGARRA